MACDPRAVNRETPMPTEIEAKFRLEDVVAFRARLEQAGTPVGPPVLETNRIFDTPDGRLRAAGCGLRVREVRSLAGDSGQIDSRPALLTFKGPVEAGQFKVREELETPVHDAAALIAILGRLGFREVVLFEKRRETWRVPPCTVLVDELPRLGWFAEIEGPDETAVAQVRTRLGLAAAPLVRETYVALAGSHGDRRAGEPCRLLFDPPVPG